MISTKPTFPSWPLATLLAVSVVLTSTGPAVASEPNTQQGRADWTYWRGPLFNGTAEATNLVEDWDPDGGPGSNLIWKLE